MTFERFNLPGPIQRAVLDLGFTEPTEIQEKAIPILNSYASDFVGQAQTGTGKTAAFVIPLLQQIDPNSKKVQALIITPTRELANQVDQEVHKLAKYLPIKSTTVYGGVSYDKQITALKRQLPQIVVGTPGRLIDLINKKILKLDNCHNLIIDEADEMLNMGFIEDVQTIIESIHKDKTMWMFSATMPAPIVRLIGEKFCKPKIIRIEKETLSNSDIQQFYTVLKRKYFPEALQRVLECNPECYGMVFCETRHETKELSELLITKGISLVTIHGELSQHERDYAMNKFKNKKVDLLICTDVAARGIDVSNMTHVFNMGLPRQSEAYVHRIGRTGRAGMKGTAISFIGPDEFRRLRQIENLVGKKIEPLKLPQPKELKKIKILKELSLMENYKGAIVEKNEAFTLDPTFKYFQSYFQDMSKDQILKLLFSYRFNRDLRLLDDIGSLELAPTPPRRSRGHARHGGASRRKVEKRKYSRRRSPRPVA